MGKEKKFVEICIERGTMNNGVRIETKVYLLSRKKEKKLKPSQTTENKRINQGRDYYQLPAGKRCRIETIMLKKHRASQGSVIVVAKEDGQIRRGKWEGDFIPQFSLP